jgi:hypothetical protein
MQPVGNVQHGAAVAPRVIQNYGTVLKCYAFNYNGLCTQTACTSINLETMKDELNNK